MIRAALILATLAGPAFAQGRSDADAYFDALLNCLFLGNKVSAMETANSTTWLNEVDPSTGLHKFVPNYNANTFIVMEPDDLEDTERVCDAVSLTISTDEANLLMQDMMTNNVSGYSPGPEDENGCKTFTRTTIGVETVVSVMSSSENPTCEDPSKSTIRVIVTYNYDY